MQELQIHFMEYADTFYGIYLIDKSMVFVKIIHL